MKHHLLTTIAAVLVVGCGPPARNIWQTAYEGNIEVVKQHLAASTDVNAKDGIGGKTTARMGEIKDQYLVGIFEHELGQVPILPLPWRIASPIFQ
ncbi:hypothetical protein OAA59_00325 [bacterium]|nr:hypothetical protein [bacterium]